MKRFLSSALLAGVAFIAAPSAHAAVALPHCQPSDIGLSGSPAGFQCVGFLSTNLIGGSPAKVGQQQAALDTLSFGGTIDWTALDVPATHIGNLQSQLDPQTVDFGPLLYGTTFIGVHFGNVSGFQNLTAFYKFDAGLTGLDTIHLAFASASNAILYKTGTPPPPPVPEPSTWAMMLAGFGAVGFAMRRRRDVRVSFA